MDKIKILVISDIPFFLEGIKAFLSSKLITAHYQDHSGVIENLVKYSPDIVVLEDSFEDQISLTFLVSAITKNKPGIKILVYTVNKSIPRLRELIDAGTKALLYTKSKKELLFEALEQLEKGRIHFDDYFNNVVLAQSQDEEIRSENLIGLLSKREKEILILLSKGLKNKEMANRLCISQSTVERHKANIIRKLHLKSSTELLIFAHDNC